MRLHHPLHMALRETSHCNNGVIIVETCVIPTSLHLLWPPAFTAGNSSFLQLPHAILSSTLNVTGKEEFSFVYKSDEPIAFFNNLDFLFLFVFRQVWLTVTNWMDGWMEHLLTSNFSLLWYKKSNNFQCKLCLFQTTGTVDNEREQELPTFSREKSSFYFFLFFSPSNKSFFTRHLTDDFLSTTHPDKPDKHSQDLKQIQ